MGRLYRPRMYAELSVPLFGETSQKREQQRDDGAIRIPLRIRRFSLESNDHNHADTLSLTTDWRDAGVDPRMLASARVQFYFGLADDSGRWKPTRQDLRFVGVMHTPERSAGGGGDSFDVNLSFTDYTDFFLKQVHFPPDAVPDLSDSLRTAWRRICENVGYYSVSEGRIVSSVSDLAASLSPSPGVDLDRPMSDGVAARFKTKGKVQVKAGCDAWAVWNQCCGMLGLITFVRLDQIIVTTATDYYTLDDPPVMIWGRNIGRWTEAGDANRTHKGVGITSFNPLTTTVLESFYPPPGDPRLVAKRPKGTPEAKPDLTLHSEDYEMFEVPGITDQKALDATCQRIFEEYSRQAIEGCFETGEILVSRQSGDEFDMVSLAAGDAVRVVFEDEERLEISRLISIEDRITYLVGRGYAPQVAELMARNVDAFRGISSVFHAKSVRTTCETNESDGSFSIEVNYCNLIDPYGNAGPGGQFGEDYLRSR